MPASNVAGRPARGSPGKARAAAGPDELLLLLVLETGVCVPDAPDDVDDADADRDRGDTWSMSMESEALPGDATASGAAL